MNYSKVSTRQVDRLEKGRSKVLVAMADETNVEVVAEIEVEWGEMISFVCSRWRGREACDESGPNPCVRATRAIFTSLFYEGLSLSSVARESLESHAGGAWPERGQLTHVYVVRALYYMLYVTDVPFYRQRRNQWESRSHKSLVIKLLRNEYRIILRVFFYFFFLCRSHLCPNPRRTLLENVTALYRFGVYLLDKSVRTTYKE